MNVRTEPITGVVGGSTGLLSHHTKLKKKKEGKIEVSKSRGFTDNFDGRSELGDKNRVKYGVVESASEHPTGGLTSGTEVIVG